jgi:predicted transcriptional regulator
MNSKDETVCDKYDLAEDKLKSFTRSAVRTKVMLCLLAGDLNVRSLETELGTRTSTILHTVKDMINENLVAKTSQGYALTNVGRIQALLLAELMNTISVLEEHQDFWLTHDISGIPVDLQMKIGMLDQSDMVVGDSMALLKAQEYFMDKVLKSRKIWGVSPIIIPGYAEAMAIPIQKGAQVDLILTDTILKIVLKEYRDLMKVLMERDNFRLYRIKDDIKVAFTVTDADLYMGLFRLDGRYDIGQDLYCVGDGAVAWGLDLFKYYRDLSEPLEKIDLF